MSRDPENHQDIQRSSKILDFLSALLVDILQALACHWDPVLYVQIFQHVMHLPGRLSLRLCERSRHWRWSSGTSSWYYHGYFCELLYHQNTIVSQISENMVEECKSIIQQQWSNAQSLLSILPLSVSSTWTEDKEHKEPMGRKGTCGQGIRKSNASKERLEVPEPFLSRNNFTNYACRAFGHYN